MATAGEFDVDVSLRRQRVKLGKDGERLAEKVREQAGKLTVIAGTGDAATKVHVGQKVRAVGVRLPSVQMEPVTEPKAAPSDAMTGEDMAAELDRELVPLFPEGKLRVRYSHPSVWIDYYPMALKVKVTAQRAFGVLAQGPLAVTADQSTGPQGLFRTKQGTPREVCDYVVRFFRRLRDKPVVEVPATGGKRRHAGGAKMRARARATRKRAASPAMTFEQAVRLFRCGL